MNIRSENSGKLQQSIFITLEPADYQPEIERSLREVRKKVELKGFRKGMVPTSVVKKMYGQNVMVDEVNKLIDKTLTSYLTENKIDIFAQPLPNPPDEDFKFDDGETMTFSFEVGLKPELNVSIPSEAVSHYKIVPSESQVEESIKNLRNRHYENPFPESVEDGDVVFLKLVELDENNIAKTGGINVVSTIKTTEITDPAVMQSLIGQSKTFKLNVHLDQLYSDNERKAKALKIDEEKLVDISPEFSIEITNILREGLAELNTTFFNKAFGESVVNSEEELTARIKEDLSTNLQGESNGYTTKKVIDGLIETINPELPVAFLKRWLQTSSKNEIKPEQMDAYFAEFLTNLKKDIIENTILENNGIAITPQEVVAFVKESLNSYYSQYGVNLTDEQLRTESAKFLEKEENYSRYYSGVKAQKIEAFLMEKLPLAAQEITHDEFMKIAGQPA